MAFHREEQKLKNRLRLMFLLAIYPIYKTVDYFIKEDFAWAVVMLGVSITYCTVLLYIYLRRHNR